MKMYMIGHEIIYGKDYSNGKEKNIYKTIVDHTLGVFHTERAARDKCDKHNWELCKHFMQAVEMANDLKETPMYFPIEVDVID